MGGVDRDAGDDAHGEGEADVLRHREVAAGPEPAGEHQAGVLDRDEDVGAPAVVPILLEPFEDAVGGVARVHADRDVEQREGAEDEQRAEVPEDPPPGQLDEAEGDERRQRHDQAEQPGIALAVAPAGGVELDLLAVRVTVGCCLHRLHASLSGTSNVFC